MTALLDDDAPDLPLLHERDYVVRAYAAVPDEILVRGVIHDVKPPGLLVEGDTEPLVMHHMVVELPACTTRRSTSPPRTCRSTCTRSRCARRSPRTTSRSSGSRLRRGFTHKARVLFGGPCGCSHTTALLQAMAPVAVQAWFGMARLAHAGDPTAGQDGGEDPLSIVRSVHRERNLNTCHIWAEDSELPGWRNGARRCRSRSPCCGATPISDARPEVMRFGLDVAQQRMPGRRSWRVAQFAEELGFDGAWGFDHFQPMYGEGPGECFEGMTTLAALAASRHASGSGCSSPA